MGVTDVDLFIMGITQCPPHSSGRGIGEHSNCSGQ